MDDVARWFLVGLGNVIMVNDPELIVLQGVYVRAGPRFLTRIREGLRQIGLPDVEKPVRIEYSKMGEERGVIGGAAFVIEDFFARQVF
jgi:predicted NBD/HSP70 family sugar kinase